MSKGNGDLEKSLQAWKDAVSKVKSEKRSRFPLTVIPDDQILYTPLDLKDWDRAACRGSGRRE